MSKNKVVLSLSDDQSFIQIGGDIDALRKDRRMTISLRRLDQNFDSEAFRINVYGRNITDLLRELHDAFAKRGYEDINDKESSLLLEEFYSEQK